MFMYLSAGWCVCLPAWTWWSGAACSTKTSCPSHTSSSQSERCSPSIFQPRLYQNFYRLVPKRVWYNEVSLFSFFFFYFFSLEVPYFQFLPDYNVCCFVAGASQSDPGDHQQCSCDSQSAGFREEEADSSEAAHTQDCRSVSGNPVNTKVCF